jgi:hypothetical protein
MGLSAGDRARLERIVRDRNSPVKHVYRAPPKATHLM